ncbi:MAG TPA: HD domain-containing protein [Hanamia sp.]
MQKNKTMETQTLYQEAIKFAAGKHADKNQTISGTNLPYVVHLSNVAMEVLMASKETEKFDLKLAIQMALLHDTLEDTNTTFDELEKEFNPEVADGVLALTKDSKVASEDRMTDSLSRIKKLPKEVWIVKLADRITNLQVPPAHWSLEKIQKYQKQAIQIFQELQGANAYLGKRLQEKINEYGKYCDLNAESARPKA